MNVTLRAIRPGDLEQVHAMHRRAETHDRIPFVTPRAEFESWLDDPHLELETDTRLAESAGELIGWGRVWHRPSGERLERAYLFGAVDPAHRGRGVGSRMLAWQLARAEARLRAASLELPRFVRAWAYEHQESAARLYRRHGFAAVRFNDELLRDLTDLPAAPATAGVTIAAWDPARSEEARRAHNDAFLDHWGTTPMDPAAWVHELAAYGSRLDLSFLATEGDRVIGMSRNGHFPDDETVTGRRDGWIQNVSVLRSHRKRGIASALILASLAAFRDAGFTHSALGVDSENPTGAYGLYTRLGYRPMRRSTTFERGA